MRLQYSISHRRSDVVCMSHLLSDVRTTVYRRSDVAFMYLLLFTGVQECSPLMLLYLFDLVWDILPDMMHINTGIWHRHFLKMLTGTRFPATVKFRKKNSAKENKALAEDHKACVNHLKSWVLKTFHYPFIGSEYWTCKAIRSPVMRFPLFVLASGVQ